MLERIARDRVVSLTVAMALLMLAVGMAAPGFLSPRTASLVWSNATVLLFVALGLLPVLLTRNVDVSGGSILGLSAVVLGLSVDGGASVGSGIALALVAGTLAGAFNGALVAGLGVPSIVATLGTLGLYRGLMLIATGGTWIEDLPSGLKALAAKGALGVAPLGWAVALVALVVALAVDRSSFGQWVKAVGDNRVAARHLGLPVRRIEFAAFTFAGFAAALAGVAFAAQIGFVPNQAGAGVELRAIAALVLGGVSLLGGVGTVPGVLLGVLFLSAIDSALVFLRIPAYWNDLIGGAMLLAVLLLDGRLRIALERRHRAERYRRSAARETATGEGRPA